MTRDEAVAMIKLQMGFRTDLDESIVLCMHTAQAQLENEAVKPWFLLTENLSSYTTENEPRLQLPTNFLMEYEENGITYLPANDGEPVQLYKNDLDVLEAYYKLQTGPPEAYALVGNYFRIFPLPDGEYPVKMNCYVRDTKLDTNIENKWLKEVPYLLMGFAGLLISSAARNSTGLATFTQWRNEGRTELYRMNEARKHTNTSPQIGGPH